MYQIIPEKIIKSAADDMKDTEPHNSFFYLLSEGEQFKKANLAPVYLLNTLTKEVIVTSRECMRKKYH